MCALICDPGLPTQEQGNSDSILDDVACLLGCTRSSLHGRSALVCYVTSKWGKHTHSSTQSACMCLKASGVGAVVASEKGVVVGKLSFREDGDLIDCQRMGVGGKAIPPNVDKVSTDGYPFANRCLFADFNCIHTSIKSRRELSDYTLLSVAEGV